MGLGREESKSRVVALVTNMVISELIHEFGVGYHLHHHHQNQNGKLEPIRLRQFSMKVSYSIDEIKLSNFLIEIVKT